MARGRASRPPRARTRASCSRSAPERVRLLADLREEARARRGAAQTATRGLASNEDLLDLEVVVEDDHVGGQPDVEPPGLAVAEHGAGTAVAALSALLERRAERDQVADGLDHRERAAGEHAVGPRTTPSRDVSSGSPRLKEPSAAPAPATASVTSATRPAAARHTSDGRLGGEVVAVDDDADVTSARASAAPTMPGSRWLSGPHRVEEVRDACARRGRTPLRLRGGRVAVPDETAMPRAPSRSISSSAPGSSGASVIRRTGPAASSRSSSRGPGRGSADAGCTPSRRGERNGPSTCAPRTRGPSPFARHGSRARRAAPPRAPR